MGRDQVAKTERTMTSTKTQFLHCRVTPQERAAVESIVLALDTKDTRRLGQEIGARIAASLPLFTVSDFLRVCCGLDPLREEGDATTGRPRSKTPSRAALHKRAARGDEEARKALEEMGVKPRAKRGGK